MGTYRQPGLNTNVNFATINQVVAEGQKAFQANFEQMRKEYAANAARNQKAKDKQDLARANGMAKWNKALKTATPKGGFTQTQDEFLREKQSEYFNLLGKNDEYSLSRLGQLLALPDEMSSGQGAFQAIGKQYEASTNLGDGTGGVDWYNSDAMHIDYLQDYQLNGAGNITPREIDGNMYWVLTDPETGEEQTLNNHELVKGSLEGNSFFATTGDISATMKPFMEEQIAGLPGDYKGKTITDKRGNTQTSYKDYKDDNDALRANLAKSDFSKTMSNQKYMTSVFPQLINRVQKAADAGDEEAMRLLYGDDMKPGGTGDDADYDMLTNEKAHAIDANLSVGSWVGSEPGFGEIADKQKAIAKFGMVNWAMDSENGLVKPDRVQTGITYTSGNSGNSGMTAAQKNFYSRVQKPENIKRYNDIARNADQVVNRFEFKDDGDGDGIDVMVRRSEIGVDLLVSQLNQAAKDKALNSPNNPSVAGAYDKDANGNIVFKYNPSPSTGKARKPLKGIIDFDVPKDQLLDDVKALLGKVRGIKPEDMDYYNKQYGSDRYAFKYDEGDKNPYAKSGSAKGYKIKPGKSYKPKDDAELEEMKKKMKKGDILIYNNTTYQKTK
jgi:hypothetical protein